MQYLSNIIQTRSRRFSSSLRSGRCILIMLVLLSANMAKAQVPPAEPIEEKFDKYRTRGLEEKLFVHTDKSQYVPGEICWFKIYYVDAYFHRPLSLAKCAYVEILDKNNKPVLQAKIALQKNGGDGSLYLPATLSSGSYRLRAYTNWMKNYGPDYFFEKSLTIINAQKIQAGYTVSSKPAYDIAFFPEGGNLVSGISSKVGFRIIDQFGKSVDAEGAVFSEKGDTVAKFRPLKFGIGSFTFKPVAGAAYKAIIRLPEGEKKIIPLPQIYTSGYVMHLENSGKGSIKVLVQAAGKTGSSLFLFVHTRNMVKAVLRGSLQNGQAEFLLDENKPGEGISHFTLFDENREPVCERLFFKKPLQGLHLKATATQAVYGTRKKIDIDISANTEKEQPVAAEMSMAVYRINSSAGIDDQDISSYLLLSADLSGTVESPAYYFQQNDNATDEALDNLMLTQGWRKFKWEDVLADKKPVFHFLPEINGHVIHGRVTALQPGMPLRGVKTYLSVPGTRTQFQTATADDAGNVKFEMKDFYSAGDIVVQTDMQKDTGYHIDIGQPFFTGYSQKLIPGEALKLENGELLNSYIASQVQNTYLYNQLSRSIQFPADTAAFYGKPDNTYLLDNYVRFTTLEEVLREYVPEVNVRQHNGRFHLPVYDLVGRFPFNAQPLVLLDGVPVFDINKMMAYDALKIRKMEVVSREYYLGDNYFEGIINFTTYKGDMPGFEIDPHATILDYEGLQLQRDFYSPIYQTAEQIATRLPDFRNLLYWIPRLSTDGSGKTKAGFYSSDIPGRYAIVIQGICEDGRSGSKVAYFEVKSK